MGPLRMAGQVERERSTDNEVNGQVTGKCDWYARWKPGGSSTEGSRVRSWKCGGTDWPSGRA